MNRVLRPFALVSMGILATAAMAAPARYDIDPQHTYPSFEADHFGGMSVFRGKFNKSQGNVTIDREAQTGTVEVTIDLSSVNTGNEKLDAHLKGGDFFEVAKFPTATYKGTLAGFKDGAPTLVKGELTMKGVTRPVTLSIRSFKCMTHPMAKVEFCGADAEGTINREEFGVGFGKNMGFRMETKLAIQVEALAAK